jgi:hypothetical protein
VQSIQLLYPNTFFQAMNKHTQSTISQRHSADAVGSPEKDRCHSCGRQVKAQQMSRHFSHFPQCIPVSQNGSPSAPQQCHQNSNSVAAHPTRRSSSRLSTGNQVGLDSNQPLPHNQDDNHFDIDNSNNNSPFVSEVTNGHTSIETVGDCGDNTEDFQEDHAEDAGPLSSMLNSHQDYVDSMHDRLNLSLFSIQEKAHLDLLQTLGQLGAPMKSFDAIMQWKNRSIRNGYIFRDETIPSRKAILTQTSKRLNRESLKPIVGQLYLPYSDVTVDITYYKAASVLADLASDVELNTSENLIFDGDWNVNRDPFAVPDGSTIGDLNTGKAFRMTHKNVCKNPNDMLLACPLAIDQTVCDVAGAARLPLEPIQIQWGNVKFDVRKKASATRVLGYINRPKVEPKRVEAGYFEAPINNAPIPMFQNQPTCNDATWKCQEYHMQIEYILRMSGFIELQERGFKWNIKYRGEVYPAVLYPFVPFIIGDTEGHDQLCGHYKSRTKSRQLCRTCEVPTHKTGWSKARRYPKRKPGKIKHLVTRRDFTKLQDMSQRMLISGFDDLRFGLHSDCGIFGACPGEILHLVLLGWFKYVVESFFHQIGGGKSAENYIALCRSIALQLSRQSDRDFPRTTTNDFSTCSNIPGHEYTGILLIMLIAFDTTRYGEVFDDARATAAQGRQKDKHPRHECFISDWKLLLTSLLEWWAWMKQPEMARRHVRRSKYATSALVRLLKEVAPRLKGMKNNTIKTHLPMHMAEDIENFGVPEVFNSAYSESAHITIAKKTVRNTQKRNKTYVVQAAHRYTENLVIEQVNRHITSEKSRGTHRHGSVWIGKSYTISKSALGTPLCHWKRAQSSALPLELNYHLMQTVTNHLLPCLDPPIVYCQTEYKCQKGVLYRAHPNYDEKPWYDHVMIDWDDVAFPARILCIVNLSNAKPNSILVFPGQSPSFAKQGLYIIIQSYNPINKEAERQRREAALDRHSKRKRKRPRHNMSSTIFSTNDDDDDTVKKSIFEMYKLQVLPNSTPSLPTLYIVNVDSIVGPTVGISDISRHYSAPSTTLEVTEPSRPTIFLTTRRQEWANNWTEYIDWKHHHLEESDESSEEEDKMPDASPDLFPDDASDNMSDNPPDL